MMARNTSEESKEDRDKVNKGDTTSCFQSCLAAALMERSGYVIPTGELVAMVQRQMR